jgi:hypothetical protein
VIFIDTGFALMHTNIKKLENYRQATRFPFLTKKNMNLWAPKIDIVCGRLIIERQASRKIAISE